MNDENQQLESKKLLEELILEPKIRAGILYAVTDSGIVPYIKTRCPLTAVQCSTSCKLWNKEKSECKYSSSLRSPIDSRVSTDYKELYHFLDSIEQKPKEIREK